MGALTCANLGAILSAGQCKRALAVLKKPSCAQEYTPRLE
jgi:hypothetical protein